MSTLKTNNIQHVDRSDPSIIINTDGSVNIAGTMTYEDVTNVDSVGIITGRELINAQKQVHVGTGVSIAAGGLNVTAGITTVQALQASTVTSTGTVTIPDTIVHAGDTNTKIRFPDADTISFETAGSERVRVDSGGQVGLSVTPDTWSTGHGLTIGTSQATLWGAGDQINLSGNAYFNSGWKAAATKAGASQIQQALGVIDFRVSGSVTADAAITFIDALRITKTGNVEIDSFNSPSTRTLSLRTGYLANANGGVGLAAKDHSGSAADGLGLYGTDGVSIHTANAGTVYERLRINTDGKVGINSASPEAQLMVLQANTVANSLTFKAAAGQIFRNEDAEFAFGLSNSNPYPLFIQGRYKNNSARNIAINPLGGLLLLGSEKSDYNTRLGNKLAIVGTTAYTGLSISNYAGTNASHTPLLDFNRSRGTSDGSLTAVVHNDKLGELIFRGSNGSDFTDAVAIRAYADTVNAGGGHVNGRFEIHTSQNGANAVKVGISSQGYLTVPYQPACCVRSTASAIDTGGENTIVAVTFTSAITNRGNHYSTSTGKFTTPIGGVYHVSCGFLTRKGAATNASHNAFIYKNGTNTGVQCRDINSANEQHITAVGVVDCNAGDELQVHVSNAGGDFWSDYNYFNVYLIG